MKARRQGAPRRVQGKAMVGRRHAAGGAGAQGWEGGVGGGQGLGRLCGEGDVGGGGGVSGRGEGRAWPRLSSGPHRRFFERHPPSARFPSTARPPPGFALPPSLTCPAVPPGMGQPAVGAGSAFSLSIGRVGGSEGRQLSTRPSRNKKKGGGMLMRRHPGPARLTPWAPPRGCGGQGTAQVGSVGGRPVGRAWARGAWVARTGGRAWAKSPARARREWLFFETLSSRLRVTFFPAPAAHAAAPPPPRRPPRRRFRPAHPPSCRPHRRLWPRGRWPARHGLREQRRRRSRPRRPAARRRAECVFFGCGCGGGKALFVPAPPAR